MNANCGNAYGRLAPGLRKDQGLRNISWTQETNGDRDHSATLKAQRMRNPRPLQQEFEHCPCRVKHLSLPVTNILNCNLYEGMHL